MGHPTHRTVLVGIGDADLPEAALRYAAADAVRRGLGVRLVHVAHPPVAPVAPEQLLIGFEAADLVGRQVLTGAHEHLVHLVEELLDQQAGGRRTREQQDAVPVEVDNQRGSVVPRLLDMCTGAEEIVLEHRAWSRMHRVLTGSVVTGVACRAHVPVVAVPEGWTPPSSRTAAWWSAWPPPPTPTRCWRARSSRPGPARPSSSWCTGGTSPRPTTT